MGCKLIKGVIITPLKRIVNPKGDILHAIKKTDKGYLGFGEAYFSTVNFNDIKGWKRHREMTLNLVVPVGAIKFVIYDDRKDSDTYKRFMSVIISQNNYCRLTIPKGLWMGFMGVGEELNLLMNLADIEHDPAESDRLDIDIIDYNWYEN